MGRTMGYRWITRRRRVCGGEPIIRGTRLPVRAVIASYKQGMTFEEILDGYPGISPVQLHEAFLYYYRHEKAIEKSLRPVDPAKLAAEHGLTLTPEGFFVKERRRGAK